MPVQYFDEPGGAQRHSPERRLILAVLEHAVATVMRGTGAPSARARQKAAQAHAWITGDDVDWPYAFRNICDHLALDANAFRERLARWQARRLAATDGMDPFRFPFVRQMVGAPRLPYRRWRDRRSPTPVVTGPRDAAPSLSRG